MASDAEAALLDVLEAQGLLGKVRAMLRMAVFTSVDEYERGAGLWVTNPKTSSLVRSTVGRLTLQLVARFLEYYELDQTLCVLKAETGLSDEALTPPRGLPAAVFASFSEPLPYGPDDIPLLEALVEHAASATAAHGGGAALAAETSTTDALDAGAADDGGEGYDTGAAAAVEAEAEAAAAAAAAASVTSSGHAGGASQHHTEVAGWRSVSPIGSLSGPGDNNAGSPDSGGAASAGARGSTGGGSTGGGGVSPTARPASARSGGSGGAAPALSGTGNSDSVMIEDFDSDSGGDGGGSGGGGASGGRVSAGGSRGGGGGGGLGGSADEVDEYGGDSFDNDDEESGGGGGGDGGGADEQELQALEAKLKQMEDADPSLRTMRDLAGSTGGRSAGGRSTGSAGGRSRGSTGGRSRGSRRSAGSGVGGGGVSPGGDEVGGESFEVASFDEDSGDAWTLAGKGTGAAAAAPTPLSTAAHGPGSVGSAGSGGGGGRALGPRRSSRGASSLGSAEGSWSVEGLDAVLVADAAGRDGGALEGDARYTMVQPVDPPSPTPP